MTTKAAGKCSGRCIRWYPRLELPRGPDGTRRFEALGGYPTRTHAEAALADALARRSHDFAPDPTKLTVNQYLDRWLTHVRSSLRARTVARYTALLGDHVRPSIGARPLKQLAPLEVQAIYDRLVVGGRRDGKPGGLTPQHILAVHRRLHRALQQAVTWRLIAHNVATDASPPPVPTTEVIALAPEQVAVLLDAAARTTSPWLGPWTVLAAATGARNGELCGLNGPTWTWRAAPSSSARPSPSSTPTVLSDDADGHGGAGMGGGRKELAVGPLKSTASNAILTLPPFAVQALRRHRRHQHRLRLALGQPTTLGLRFIGARPATPPGRARPGVSHRAGHAGQPQPRQPRLRSPGRQRRAGRPPAPVTPCPGVGDGSQQRTGQHHRRAAAPRRRRRPRPTGVHPPAAPDRTPRGWGDRSSVRPPSPCWAGGVGWASGGGNVEGTPALQPDLTGRPATALLLVRGYVAGTGFEPV